MSIKQIICVFLLLPLLFACKEEPEVIYERLPLSEAEEELKNDGDPDNDIFIYRDSSEAGDLYSPRTCMAVETAFSPPAADDSWLKQEVASREDKACGVDQACGPIEYVVTVVDEQLEEGIEAVFERLSEALGNTLVALMALAIIAYAVSITVGASRAHPYQIAMMAIKFAAISALVAEWSTFDDVIRNFLENTMDGLVSIMSNTFSGEEVQEQKQGFIVADRTLAMFFSIKFLVVVLALFFTGWTGAFYGAVLGFVIVAYIFAILRASYVYIIALIARSLLYAVAPLFLIALVFNQTQPLFKNWLRQMINFTLQPIILFAFLGLFHQLVMGFLGVLYEGGAEGMEVCYMEFSQEGGTDNKYYWWGLSSDGGLNRVGGPNPPISINMLAIFTLAIMSAIMFMLSGWAVEVATHLSSGFVSAAGVPLYGWPSVQASVTGAAGTAASTTRGFFGTQNAQGLPVSGFAGMREGYRQGVRRSVARQSRALQSTAKQIITDRRR